MELDSAKRRCRTIWVSDVHLGTRDSRADMLLDFLREHETETLYLVGDLIDGWALKKKWWWHESHDAVIAEILARAARGTRVVYVPGNHDEFLRDYVGHRFAGVEVVHDTIHVTAEGRRLWVLHGDEFDLLLRDHEWLVKFGDMAYAVLLRANRMLNAARAVFGRPYWSLAAAAKGQAKKAMEALSDFSSALTKAARAQGADGVVCGHIHHAELRLDPDGFLYANDGDWVDSCTALVEDLSGRLELVRWNRTPPTTRSGAPPPVSSSPSALELAAASGLAWPTPSAVRRRPPMRPDRRRAPYGVR